MLGNIAVSDASCRRFSCICCTDLTPQVPYLQPSADQDSKQSGHTHFLCGYMAIEKYSLLSTGWVAGPSSLLSALTRHHPVPSSMSPHRSRCSCMTTPRVIPPSPPTSAQKAFKASVRKRFRRCHGSQCSTRGCS